MKYTSIQVQTIETGPKGADRGCGFCSAEATRLAMTNDHIVGFACDAHTDGLLTAALKVAEDEANEFPA